MFVEEALHMAIWTRAQQGHHLQTGPHLAQEDRTIHHSDAGSQYTSLRYTETIDLEGLRPSIGTVGDAYDNAQAESVMGLFKNEAVRKDSPLPGRPLENSDRRRRPDAGLGHLVQPGPTPQHDRLPNPERSRTTVSSRKQPTRCRCLNTEAAPNPGRFIHPAREPRRAVLSVGPARVVPRGGGWECSRRWSQRPR